MATDVYRFRWNGIDLTALTSEMDPAIAIVTSAPVPDPQVDVELTASAINPSDEIDLVAAMLAQGWTFVEKNPAAPLLGVTILTQVYEYIFADESVTTAEGWKTLLSVAINTPIDLFATAETAISSSVATGPVLFRFLLDGVPIAGMGAGHGPGLGGNAIRTRQQLLAGAHTLTLEWSVPTLADTAQIRAATMPESEGASLNVYFTDK